MGIIIFPPACMMISMMLSEAPSAVFGRLINDMLLIIDQCIKTSLKEVRDMYDDDDAVCCS